MKIFIIHGHDTEDDYLWLSGHYKTFEEAKKEFDAMVHEDIYHCIGLGEGNEDTEFGSDEYNKFWEENTIEDVLSSSENSEYNERGVKIDGGYGRTIQHSIVEIDI